MKDRLNPHFEDFLVESLSSYFEILREELDLTATDNFINKITNVFFRYTNCSRSKLEEVIKIRRQFVKREEQRELLKMVVEENHILPIFYNYFGHGDKYLKYLDQIVDSAVSLFFKIAMDFSKLPILN